MRRIACILIIAAIVLIGTVVAAPVLPGEFYGSVYLNGNPAPAGTVIIAQINGEARGNITTTVDGLYGGPGNFDPRLIVTSNENEVNAGNATITFLVGGVQAFQTAPFKSGDSEKLDLLANSNAFKTVTTTMTPAYSSSGGASGVSGGSGGYVASSSSAGTTSGSSAPGTAATQTTPSRSSIYYNIDNPQTTATPTILQTTVTTPSPVVTTVPATKKAGAGMLSAVVLIFSIIAMLCIAGRTEYSGKLR